jgi:hypothetical protein
VNGHGANDEAAVRSSSEGDKMRDHNSGYVTEKSHKAIEELKLKKVGLLLQIIDELKEMKLSIEDIEAVLGACGLNYSDAMELGNEIRVEEKKDKE